MCTPKPCTLGVDFCRLKVLECDSLHWYWYIYVNSKILFPFIHAKRFLDIACLVHYMFSFQNSTVARFLVYYLFSFCENISR